MLELKNISAIHCRVEDYAKENLLREKYDISQRELTSILGFGKMTINRYERGGIPTKSQSDYIRVLIENENECDDFDDSSENENDSDDESEDYYLICQEAALGDEELELYVKAVHRCNTFDEVCSEMGGSDKKYIYNLQRKLKRRIISLSKK